MTSASTLSGFVISDNQIYIGESSDDNIEMAPLMPGKNAGAREATVIAAGQMKLTQFAADPTNIYWRTDDCKIMKLAK
jgi:hypothetical protein